MFFYENEDISISFLYNSPITMFYNINYFNETIKLFKLKKYEIYNFDTKKWISKESFHYDISKILNFPVYYGNNLEALNDCISDLYNPEIEGIIFILNNYDCFNHKLKELSNSFLDILADNSRKYLLVNMKLIIFIHSNDPKLYIEPVGKVPILWNIKEFLDKSRGL
jgi:RNAse (barnase) inhibitor barstar